MKPTVTVGDAPAAQTPTQQVVADANRIIEVVDARGRRIGVRRMSMSVRRRTFKGITPAAAENTRYLGLVMVAACVVSIDGQSADALALGGSELAFDNLIDRLDDEGFDAVGTAIAENFAPAASKDDIKNG